MASLTLACAMRGDRDSDPGPVTGSKTLPLAPTWETKYLNLSMDDHMRVFTSANFGGGSLVVSSGC